MATKAELLAEVTAKIDASGRRLTTAIRLRDILNSIINAIFDQFSTLPVESTVSLASINAGTVLTFPSATYTGEISNVIVWVATSNPDEYKMIRPIIVIGVSGSDKTVRIITGKAYTNARITVTFE